MTDTSKLWGEVSELNYCLKEGVTCVFLACEQVSLPGLGGGGGGGLSEQENTIILIFF